MVLDPKKLQALKLEPADPKKIPDGHYDGHWDYFTLNFTAYGTHYQLQMDSGMRNMNVPCTVTVKDGEIIV